MNARLHHVNFMILVVSVALTALWPHEGRADAPPNRYTFPGGTVYDTKTNLYWQQTISANSYTWADAKTYCASQNLNGVNGRLPSMKELQTILDRTRTNPTIDPTAFPTTPNARFWTSSPLAGSASGAWAVDFANGSSSNWAVTLTFRVRCVR